MKDYKVAVAGTGYVGLSIATLLSQHHHVTAVDIIPEKVEMINNRKSPIQDDYIEKYLAEKDLDLTATLDAKAAYSDADFVVIAAPTNYDSHTQHFDTSAVEAVIKLVMEYNPNAIMVIKSTIPVGYTASVREKFNSKNIIFSPEFLRESKALYDNLYPSRIIVGTDLSDERLVEAAHEFAGLLQEGAIKENIDTLFMGFTEADMNNNWFKLVMKMTKVEYGKNLLLKGVPIIFNKGGAKLKIGENVTIKSSFLSNLVGLYSRTIIVTRAPGAEIEIGDNVGISGATIYARKKITIGENTCIGGNCKILDKETSGMIQRKFIGSEIHIVSEKPEELFPCDPYKAAALKCAAELMNNCMDNIYEIMHQVYPKTFRPQLYISSSKEINAVAIGRGEIVVYAGLIFKVIELID